MSPRHLLTASLTSIALLCADAPSADPIAVRQAEGLVHGFLALRSPEGRVIASGDLIQNARGDRVTSQLKFRFKDGSTSDETGVFSQRGHLRLISYRQIHKGPAFERPMEMTIDARTGHVSVRYKNDEGEDKVEEEDMKLPPDLANGMIITVLKNVRPDALPPSVSLVVATPKPRVVKVNLSVAGADSFATAGMARKATHYVLKVEIGGIEGLIAPLLGKQPPDSHVWVLQGEAPAFVRSQAPMFMGGPMWQTELVSPVWPRGR